MAKSLVERYEQVLAEDPSSTVFVELAKALLGEGQWARAIEVCQAGLVHHPQSVVARVLWGKALIHLGKPAEAMAQFDQAVGIDRENPYAYNLISEVLLQRGLYRSALPILRKAVALQPDDGRVRQWLEQTQQALAGGPAPVLGTLSTAAPAPDAAGPQGAPPASAPPQTAPAAAPQEDGAPAAPREASSDEWQLPVDLSDTPPGGLPVQESTPARGRPAVAARSGGPPVLMPVPLEGQGPEDAPSPAGLPEAPPPQAAAPAQPSADGPSIIVSPELGLPLTDTPPGGTQVPAAAAEAPAAAGGGLLGDLPPLSEDELPVVTMSPAAARASGLQAPLSAREAGAQPSPARRSGMHPAGGGEAAARAPRASGSRAGLLEELPEASGEQALPEVVLSTQATQAIAQQYEKELREKLARAQAERGFLARNGTLLAGVAVGLVALAAFAFFFVRTRQDFGGKDLRGALGEARRLIDEDTRAALQRALATLGAAVRMDEQNSEAWALTAHAQALLATEHDGGAAALAAAVEALGREGVAEGFPHTRLVVDYLLARGRAREAAAEAVLKAQGDDAELQSLAGRLLLERGKAREALARFQKALVLQPTHVRSLAALGTYYRQAGDMRQALAMYERISAAHPEKVVGMAEARRALGQQQEDSLRALAALPPEELRTPELWVRHRLVQGGLLSETGRHAEAVEVLKEAAQKSRVRQVEVQVALSEAQRAAGHMAQAQATAEAALAKDVRSEAAREALARVLLARDRERELLQRLPAEGASRRVALLRGLARARLGEWKAARAELARTEVEGRYPPEAVVALAMADAAEGRPEKAQEVLEKVLLATRRATGDVHVALGKVYWQRGVLDKARSQFEEASKEPADVEGGCALGRLFVSQGQHAQAVAPLTQALSRNPAHGEAREALGRALLGLGKLPEALKQYEAWQLDNPGAAQAHRGHAHALYLLGKMQEAEGAAARAVKLDREDARAWLLQAIVLAARGDPEQAFRSLQRANKLDPKDPETFCEIGRTFLRQGQAENAAKAFEAAQREGPGAACGRIGVLAARPAAGRAAARELARLAREAPDVWDRAWAQATLAQVQLASGSVREARASAEQAVLLLPVLPAAHHALGLAALRTRDEARAREALAQAAALDPANAPLRLALGDVLARSEGFQERAVSEYEAFLQLPAPEADKARVRKLLPGLKQRAGR